MKGCWRVKTFKVKLTLRKINSLEQSCSTPLLWALSTTKTQSWPPPSCNLIKQTRPKGTHIFQKLPTWTGRADEWESYRDLFRSLIHSNKRLTGVQKLHYLKTSVQGEAKRAVNGITTTEANYAVAWQSLLDRYDNEHLLAQWHIYCLDSPVKRWKKSKSYWRGTYIPITD